MTFGISGIKRNCPLKRGVRKEKLDSIIST